jgi:hypothetical protein
MPTEEIAYSADGAEMRGLLATPDGGGCGPAVLVAHEAPGLMDICQERTRRLADLGFIAFALDAYGHGRLLTVDEARPQLIAWVNDPTGLHARTAAALEVLTATPGSIPLGWRPSAIVSARMPYWSSPAPGPNWRPSWAFTRVCRLRARTARGGSRARC